MEPIGPAIEAARAKLEQDESIQVIDSGGPLEATSLIKRVGTCLVLLSAPDQGEMVKQISMLKLLRELIQSKKVIVIVTTSISQRETHQKFIQYGCSEVILEPITPKSLLFKVDRFVKLQKKARIAEESGAAANAERETRAAAQVKTQARADGTYQEVTPLEARFADKVKRSKAAASTYAAAKDEEALDWKIKPALELQSDCWIARTKGSTLPPGVVKRIADKWMIKLTGPGPLIGRWNLLENDGDQENSWQWTPNDPDGDEFILEQGAWIYKGHKPEFVGEVWTFVGKRPELSFYYEGENYGSKFRIDAGTVAMAEDSTLALERLPALRASIHRVLRKASEGKAQHAEEPVKIKNDAGNADEKELGVRMSQERNMATAGEDDRANRAGSEDDALASGRSVHVVEPVSLESDCWLIDTRACRFAFNRWVARAKGPDPVYGRWVASRGSEPDERGEHYWEWSPKDPESDPFIKEQGNWYFYGEQPTFDQGVWTFKGRRATLAFFYESESYGEKLATSEDCNTLLVAADSEAALRSLGFDPEHSRVKTDVDQGGSAYRYKEEQAEGGVQDRRSDEEGDQVPLLDHRDGRGGREIPLETDDFRDRSEGAGGAKDFQDSNDGERGASGRDYRDDERPGEGQELNGSFSENRKRAGLKLRSGAEDGDASSEDAVQEARRRGLGNSIRSRLQDAGIGLSTKANQALDRIDEGLLAAGGSDRRRGESGPSAGTQGLQGPIAVRAESPSGPTLRPLTIAFLMSELLAKHQMKRTWIAQRYCAYVSSSCGGLRAELWVVQNGEWVCAGTSDENEGRGGLALDQVKEGARLRAAEGSSGAVMVAGIAETSGGGSVVGALLMDGEGIESLLPQYIDAVSQMARGLLRSLSSDPGLDEGLQPEVFEDAAS